VPAAGQIKPRAGDNVADRLTAQEFEVASLAASGLTNKQIAERLFLSHRTVSGHLHRAFPKLGITAGGPARRARVGPSGSPPALSRDSAGLPGQDPGCAMARPPLASLSRPPGADRLRGNP
jgi:DNA-binding CsgD family transcriptional regulator